MLDLPEKPDLEFLDCPLCGATDAVELFVARDRLLGRPGEFPVVRCAVCGLVRLSPRPTASALDHYYPDVYYPLDELPSAEALTVARDLQNRVQAWAKRRELDRPRVLDVGCGAGLFLHLADEAGMRVRGIEPSAAAVAYARQNYGLDVHHGTLEDAELSAASFDIVVMWHVLEHLPDPVRSLRKVAELLTPGGLLLLAVPNFGSVEARVFGRRWYSLDAPRHLVHFTPKTLRAVVVAGGLEPVEFVQSTGTAGLVYSLMGDLTGVSLKLRHRPLLERQYQRTAAILHRLAKPICIMAARLGRGGALEAYAVKSSSVLTPRD